MKKEKIKLSAIINTCNSQEFLCETIEALHQYIDEIVVIDNHSKDDTVDIVKEYKLKLVYCDKNEINNSLNVVIEELQNDWFILLNDNEIIPYNLLCEIEKYILKPRKNKNCISLPTKTFYLNREVKSFKQKASFKIFKKGFVENFKYDCFDLKLKSTKAVKLGKFKNNEFVYKYIKNDVLQNILFEFNKDKMKFKNQTSASVFLKTISCFVYWFFIKGGIFDFKRGFILSFQKAVNEFLIQTTILENNFKKEEI